MTSSSQWAYETAPLEETKDNLITDLAIARKSYGSDVLTFSVICRCLENLIRNAEVVRYLRDNHSEVLDGLQHVVRQVNVERAATE
jgi:hypothetical protein